MSLLHRKLRCCSACACDHLHSLPELPTFCIYSRAGTLLESLGHFLQYLRGRALCTATDITSLLLTCRARLGMREAAKQRGFGTSETHQRKSKACTDFSSATAT